MKRPRGRPPKTAVKRLEHRLDLRVSESEKKTFKLAADNANQDLSMWIRIQLHQAAKQELVEIEKDKSVSS